MRSADVGFGGQHGLRARRSCARKWPIFCSEPYTDRRLADIPRRLQAYYKARGYYDVKVDATGDPRRRAVGGCRCGSTISPGPVYYFDDSTVTGLQRLRPGYVTKRFSKLSGKKYDPESRGRKIPRDDEDGLVQRAANQAGAGERRPTAPGDRGRGSEEQGVRVFARLRDVSPGLIVGRVVSRSEYFRLRPADHDLGGIFRAAATRAKFSSRIRISSTPSSISKRGSLR